MMKRFLLFLAVVGMLAAQASAADWELDHPTALQFTSSALLPNTDGDTMGPLSLHPFGTGGYGSTWPIGGTVGFKANLKDGLGGDSVVGAEIYTSSPTGLPGGLWDGITAHFWNDNNSAWELQLSYTKTGAGAGIYSSSWVPINPNNNQYLTAASFGPSTLDLSTITKLGFNIRHVSTPEFSDDFHVSVPVPGASLLGILGVSVAGMKLRKFA